MNVQEQLMQFQMLQGQIEQITEHVQLLNQQMQELDASKTALQDLALSEAKSEMLAPVANGIFVKATLQDTQKLLVNVGAGTVVEKTVEEVINLLKQQEEEMSSKIMEAEGFMQHLHQKAYEIYKQVEEHVEE
ncbi:prefoldin subunit alpha [Candidatus Woesearchaeota archaeon CG10_big_fil_rev_8_21_14_0_10_45_16]|nr:MAG: prefoldin subunit alpha [Candidatus Woesearchaeota archaeon CG10_big_fil_rev_8_21_14_0_10_45_16]